MMDLLSVFVFLLVAFLRAADAKAPNILFSIVESTEASAYFPGVPASQIPLPIPTLQKLMNNGVTFLNNYVAAPVCCPSRASIVSGRHVHKIGHYQASPSTGLYVNGAWNNHEGLPSSYSLKFMDIMANSSYFNNSDNSSYAWKVFGKTDWSAGGHSLDCRVTAWCNKVNFPYTISTTSSEYGNEYMAGWYDESGPISSLINSSDPNATCHQSDWDAANELIAWVKEQKKSNPEKPWLAYFSPSIVHPPYCTSSYWLQQIDESKITLPEWVPIDSMHYEDFQASMKKRMFGQCCRNSSTGDNVGNGVDAYKLRIRKYYYAMVAEYDAMLGKIYNTIEAEDLLSDTFIVATSDHGDMNMEHQQYYKMAFYEASSNVPLIIQGPLPSSTSSANSGSTSSSSQSEDSNKLVAVNDAYLRNVSVANLTSSLDFFPTFLDIAGIDIDDVHMRSVEYLDNASNSEGAALQATPRVSEIELDGYTLLPFLYADSNSDKVGKVRSSDKSDKSGRADYVVSQFHGDEIHLSWFMVRQGEWKYVTYGTGNEVPKRLFNIANDPEEMKDYGNETNDEYYNNIMMQMDSILMSVINYTNVSADVESYNKDSYVLWRDSFSSNMTVFNQTISQLRWNHSWSYDPNGCFAAIDTWLQTPNDTFSWAIDYDSKDKFVTAYVSHTQ